MSDTGPETEVISCPACRHLLRVPLDWLGEQVQCPECQAKFRAPVRDGSGGLTAAELISRPASAGTSESRKKLDAMLLLPAFGLMVCGIAGAIVNARQGYMFFTDQAAAKEFSLRPVLTFRQMGWLPDEPGPEQDRRDDEMAEQSVRIFRVLLPAFLVASTLSLLGGLSIALRWNYRLAQIGCVGAALDLNMCCCVPGGAAGVWALLMLASEEGREHFGR